MEKIRNLEKYKKEILWLWTLMMGVSIVIRCLPTMIYPHKLIEYGVIMVFSGLTALLYLKKINWRTWNIVDICLFLTPLFCLRGSVMLKYIFFFLISLLFYVIIQQETVAIDALKYPMIIFALITSIVTWIGFIAPQFYQEKILMLFPESKELIYDFTTNNMNLGFTNHYSRNSFYITIAILYLFVMLIGKKNMERKERVAVIGLTGFFMCTQFLVAKRGLTLFMLVTMFLLIFLMEQDMKKKIRNCVIFVGGGTVLFVIACFLIPGVNNIVVRVVESIASGNISSSRFDLYQIAIDMIKDHPIVGNGWGSFLARMTGTPYQGVHNDYLQFLAETGIIGFVINMIANFGCLFFAYRTFQVARDKNYENTQEKVWVMFSFSYQLFFLMYAMTGLPHYSYEQLALYLMMCGFSMGIYRRRNSRREIL